MSKTRRGVIGMAYRTSDPYKHACLALFLEVAPEDLQEWSDGSFTLNEGESGEYILTCRPSNAGYQSRLGKAGNYYVYKN